MSAIIFWFRLPLKETPTNNPVNAFGIVLIARLFFPVTVILLTKQPLIYD